MGTAQSGSGQQAGHPAYLLMARFQREAAAKRVYTQVQEAIRNAECDLSVYNLRLNGEPVVVVVGNEPPAELDTQLRRMLATGKPAALPADVIVLLAERGIAERSRGPWSEGHYRPGKRLL